jgi:hypothetical protein
VKNEIMEKKKIKSFLSDESVSKTVTGVRGWASARNAPKRFAGESRERVMEKKKNPPVSSNNNNRIA